jgi:hypothetical protein
VVNFSHLLAININCYKYLATSFQLHEFCSAYGRVGEKDILENLKTEQLAPVAVFSLLVSGGIEKDNENIEMEGLGYMN